MNYKEHIEEINLTLLVPIKTIAEYVSSDYFNNGIKEELVCAIEKLGYKRKEITINGDCKRWTFEDGSWYEEFKYGTHIESGTNTWPIITR